MKNQTTSQNPASGSRQTRRPCLPGVPIRPFLLSVCFISAMAGLLSAAPAETNKTAAPSNRFLLVIETSRAIERRSDGVYRAVRALLATGMGGQIHLGDTLGLWTFNEDLHTGVFPLQTWSPGAYRGIAGRVLNFLGDQKFEKSSHFEKVMPALGRVIQDSDYITVILVTDGNQKLEGTPFDDQINAAFKSWRTEQQEARMPFITVLRAKKGRITDYTVNPAQWPLDMPPLPPELVPVVTKPVPVVKTPPPVGPSLYLYGKKPAEPATSQPGNASAGGSPAAAAPLTTGPGALTSKPQEKPTPQTLEPAVTVSTTPASAPVSVTRTDGEPAGTARIAPDATTVATQAPSAPAPALVNQATIPAPKVEGASVPAEPIASTAAAVPTKPMPAPAAPSQPEPATSKTQPASAPASATLALPSEPIFNLRLVLIAGVILAAVVCVFFLRQMRRARAISAASLITRSLDRTHRE